MDIKTLIAVATGKIPHNYRSGLCPDELQPDSRDPDCPACKILIEAATEHGAMEHRLREAEATTAAARDVLAERRRQIEAEGWTPEHDDAHKNGSLSRAGGFYALNAGAAMWYGTTDTSICDTAPDGWPWDPDWWKPVNARRDLVKASALIIAEIERIDRMQPTKGRD